MTYAPCRSLQSPRCQCRQPSWDLEEQGQGSGCGGQSPELKIYKEKGSHSSLLPRGPHLAPRCQLISTKASYRAGWQTECASLVLHSLCRAHRHTQQFTGHPSFGHHGLSHQQEPKAPIVLATVGTGALSRLSSLSLTQQGHARQAVPTPRSRQLPGESLTRPER